MKAIVIGNSGSGKTWLATRLARHYESPVIHLDDLFWMTGSFEHPRSETEQRQLLDQARRTPRWIAEGIFGRLAEQILPDADWLIWLDLDWSTCEKQLRARAASQTLHLGREQTTDGFAKLLVWASAYATRSNDCSRTGHAALFGQFKNKRHQLRTPAEVERFIAELDSPHCSGA